MSIYQINDLFSETELDTLNKIIENSKETKTKDDEILGRTLLIELDIPNDIKEKIAKKCSDLLSVDLTFTSAIYAEYSNLYGNPNLPPHFDGDSNNLVVDYQLKANTSWDLGIDLKCYPLQDNSALIFNANECIHWRPHKSFKDGEYVKMMFFRVYDEKNIPDNSHLNYSLNDDIFKEVRNFRDSLIS